MTQSHDSGTHKLARPYGYTLAELALERSRIEQEAAADGYVIAQQERPETRVKRIRVLAIEIEYEQMTRKIADGLCRLGEHADARLAKCDAPIDVFFEELDANDEPVTTKWMGRTGT